MRNFHVNRVAPAALLLMAALWGSTFVVLKDLVRTINPLDLTFVRYVVASLALCLLVPRALRMSRRTAVEGVVLGSMFAGGLLLQTQGLASVDASVSGFLTGLYVVFTPLLSWLLFRRKVTWSVWVAVALSTFGIAVLSLKGTGSGFGTGELITITGAALFALHILATGKVVTPNNALSLSVVQAITIAGVSGVTALPGGIAVPQGTLAWAQMGYLAVICGAVPLVAQIWAQSHVEPNRAAVIIGTEPVWAATLAVLVGGETLTGRLLVGGLLICLAIWLVVAPPNRRRGSARTPRGRVFTTSRRRVRALSEQ